MKYQLHITQSAERDLIQAADYIEFVLKNPQAADDLLAEADKKIHALLLFPKEHPLTEDKLLASWGVRFMTVKNYLVFYVVSEERSQVTVIRFFYAYSDWHSILNYGLSLLFESPPRDFAGRVLLFTAFLFGKLQFKAGFSPGSI